MGWRQDHLEAFKVTRHACGLETGVQAVIRAAIIIATIAIVWLLGAPNEAWGEILIKSGATLAILLIFPLVYLFNLFRIRGTLGRRYRKMDLNPYLVVASIGIIICAVGVGGYFATRSKTDVPESIAREFSSLRDSITQLGAARGPVIVADSVSQHEHERATVVFVKALTMTYYLKPDGKVIPIRDGNWPDDPRFYSEAERRKMPVFRSIPKHLSTPRGGIARRWANEPEKWKWLGGQEWICAYYPNNFYYQEFEKGLVLGVLRPNPTQNEGYFAVILNDDTWISRRASIPAPECKKPMDGGT